ncbi:MAG: GPW/gp25 family protein [candidate division Zixibacteria bacterium]|nr:GPW/gp25 family protein [candidate division Zixibacteria bacterium]
MEYLSLPLVLNQGYLSRCTLEESIIYSVGLILSTRLGQLPFAPEYGSEIWEREFSDLVTSNKADMRGNFRNAIDKYEKRLYNVSVSILQTQDGKAAALGLIAEVTGNYMDGNEEKTLRNSFRIG